MPIYPAYTSPLGIDGFPGLGLVYLGYAIMLLLLGGAAVALTSRWRRGDPIERTQIKWVVAAAVVTLFVEIINVATFRADEPNALITILGSAAIALVPAAIGVAILRYRLYEIDRIISRTIAYAVLTGILAAVFAGAILLLQGALSTFTQGQTVAVAASTLAVFALFQPLRRRVQSVVDHRFDRARYDAERTAVAFSVRLRHEVDMETVTSDLASTTRLTVAPSSLDHLDPTEGGRPMTRARAAWVVAVVAMLAYAAGAILDAYTDPVAVLTFGVAMASFLVVGAMITGRVPDNRIGPLFMLAGTILAVSAVTAAYGDIGLAQDPPWPGSILALAITNITFIYPIIIVLIFVPLVFPDGHLPSPRFRWVVWLAMAALAATAVNDLFRTPLLGATDIPNPMRVESLQPLLDVLNTLVSLSSIIGFGGAAAAVVVRYRRGTPVVRQQTKWLMAVAGVAAVAFPLSFLLPVFLLELQPLADVFFLIGTLALVALPWAITIAVLRYRLFEIDRLVSRTISYALVSAVLIAVYACGDPARSRRSSRRSPRARPWRSRPRRWSSSRSSSRSGDASSGPSTAGSTEPATTPSAIAVAFSGRLRNETDMATVTTDLVRTASDRWRRRRCPDLAARGGGRDDDRSVAHRRNDSRTHANLG